MNGEDTNAAAEPLVLGKVLLVDDEPEVRRTFKRSLSRAGFAVVEASNGSSALDLARLGEFEVVVSDVCMPQMGGLELLERLGVEAPDLPVVLVSGFADPATALDRGAFAFFEKPVKLADLHASVSRGVEAFRRRQVSAEPQSQRESGTCLIAGPPLAPIRNATA
jgi:two-component system C4-dicarboxylate transport response regulator DctD